jgi:hypothetical protein
MTPVLCVMIATSFAGPVPSLVVAAPLLLVVAARRLAARGRVVRAAATLLPPLLIVAAVTFLVSTPPPPPAWLIVPGWHVLLGVATLAAAVWDWHVAAARSAKTFFDTG